MKFLLVNIKNEGRKIIMIARGEDGNKYNIIVDGFYPYFYSKKPKHNTHVIRVEDGYKTLFGENVYKIVVDNPSNVPKVREEGDYEADIPYVRRFMIDTKIRDFFFIPDDKITKMDGKLYVSVNDIHPLG